MQAENPSETDAYWMRRAMTLAQQAAELDEVPVGAVIVHRGKEIGAGFNAPVSGCDPTAHAEIRALRDAGQRAGNYRLGGATLYVTLEPCTMCVGALVHGRISRLVFGAPEPKAGAVQSVRNTLDEPYLNWRIQVTGGVLADECGRLLTTFFARRRAQIRSQRRATST